MPDIEPSRDWEQAVSAAAQAGATELFLAAGQTPLCRVHGEWIQPEGAEPLDAGILESWLADLAGASLWSRLETTFQRTAIVRGWGEGGGRAGGAAGGNAGGAAREGAAGIEEAGGQGGQGGQAAKGGRLRAIIKRHAQGWCAAILLIKHPCLALSDLSAPKGLESIGAQDSGLWIFGGGSGSGRTTLMAAAVDHINTYTRKRIFYAGDPLEPLIENRQSWIDRADLDPANLPSDYFANLRNQDYDLIAVDAPIEGGALMDLLLQSQSGALVFLTGAGVRSSLVLEELVSRVPKARASAARGVLAEYLRGMVIQQLLKTADGKGVAPAFELLLQSRPLMDPIREGKWPSVPQIMSTSRHMGMMLLDDSIDALLRQATITGQEAFQHSQDKTRFLKYGPAEWQTAPA